MWVLAAVAAACVAGLTCVVAVVSLALAWIDPSEREARRAGEQLRPGMSVADLLRIADALAAPGSWTVGLQECPGTSDVFAMNYSTKTNRYEMWAIRDWKIHAEEVWRESFATREQLSARVGKPATRYCRSATLWFGSQWRTGIRLDSEGRVQTIAPARLVAD
jgi:hypothetical protein